jgi:hypothetical protein
LNLLAAMTEGEGAERMRDFGADAETVFGWPGDTDNGAVACGAGVAVVANEKMFEERIDFLMFVAGNLNVFVKGEITRAPRLPGRMKGGDGFKLDAIQFFARLLVWHGRRNHTIS